jgi:hypothetical protein
VNTTPFRSWLDGSRLFLLVVFIGLFAMAAGNVIDPDVWWHLKTGEYIAQHKTVPHADPFSYTRAGQPWVAHEWLAELLLYEVDRVAGMAGLIVLFAAITLGSFYLLYLRCGPDPFVAGVAILYGAWATMPVWGVRPQIISFLLTSLWLLILERSDRDPKILWWTLPLTVLWVNLHAGFALGLALSVLFIAGELIEGVVQRSPARTSHVRTCALFLLLDLLLVPLNPNGIRMFSYPIETLRSAAMQNYIAEWASPNFHRSEYLPFLLLVLATFAVLSWSKIHTRPRDLLLLVVSLYAGLCSIRMIPLFVLVAIPLICRGLEGWSIEKAQPLRRPSQPHPLLNGIIVLAMAAFALVHVVQVIRHQPEVEAERFPTEAVAFLQTHPSGRLFNHYDWGGYLIWKLYPSTRVFIDGRADLYGEQMLNQFAETYQLKDDWKKTLEDERIETVVVPADSALATGLRNSPDWKVSYQDRQALVLTAINSGKKATAGF